MRAREERLWVETGLFTIEDFVYDAEKDLYTCPRGEPLRRQDWSLMGFGLPYVVSMAQKKTQRSQMGNHCDWGFTH